LKTPHRKKGKGKKNLVFSPEDPWPNKSLMLKSVRLPNTRGREKGKKLSERCLFVSPAAFSGGERAGSCFMRGKLCKKISEKMGHWRRMGRFPRARKRVSLANTWGYSLLRGRGNRWPKKENADRSSRGGKKSVFHLRVIPLPLLKKRKLRLLKQN